MTLLSTINCYNQLSIDRFKLLRL